MRLLVTRPQPDATRTAQALQARGHDVLLAPLMRVEPADADLSGPWSAVLMTSANAARAIEAHRQVAVLRPLAAFAVGERSAAAARDAGFTDVVSADGALPDLVRLVAARFSGPGVRLLYLAGEDRAGDLAADLGGQGIDVQTAVVYRAVEESALPEEAVQALAAGRIDAALHYSRRSAATLRRLAEQAGLLNALLSLAHYCLSADVAEPLLGAAEVRAAAAPRETALMDLLGPV